MNKVCSVNNEFAFDTRFMNIALGLIFVTYQRSFKNGFF